MLCACVVDVMDVIFSVCIVRRGSVGARVWEVSVFRLQFHQNWSHNCLVGSHECLLLFTTDPVAESAFMICSGLCACTEMFWMCVLYVSFGSKVRHRTFGCVAMGSALLCICRSRLLVYSAGSGVNRVQVVWSGFSMR